MSNKVKIGIGIAAVLGLVCIVVCVAVFYFFGTKVNEATVAVEFNDAIVEAQQEFTDPFLALSSEAFELSDEDIETRYAEVKQIGEASLQKVRDLDVPEGGEEYHESAIALFEFYNEILNNEYRMILDLAKQDPATLTQEQIDEVTQAATEIGQREEALDARFQEAQKDFAELKGFQVGDALDLSDSTSTDDLDY